MYLSVNLINCVLEACKLSVPKVYRQETNTKAPKGNFSRLKNSLLLEEDVTMLKN